MFAKIKNYWNSLNQEITVNKREVVMGLALCALAGVVLGSALSNNVSVTIGSNNRISNAEEEAEEPRDA